MMEIGESCKLCLKYVQGTNMAVLDETILGKLEFLQMDLDQSVEDSNSVCKECEERIEKAFDFKSCLVNTESCLVPYVCEDKTQKVNLKVVIEKDNSSMSIGETSTEKEVCRLCKNFVDAIAVISLPKILKDDNVTEVFQGHIPEMDLEVTENPVVCERCQKSLASFSTLVASWSIANGMNEMEGDEDEDVKGEFEPNFEMVKVKNETIDDFSDSNTTSSTSMLEISDSAKTVKKTKKGKSTTVKTEPDSSDIVSAMNREIKTEDGEEDESLEEDLQLKSEEVEIKDEDGFSGEETEFGHHVEMTVETQNNAKSSIKKCFIQKTSSQDPVLQCVEYPYINKLPKNVTKNGTQLMKHDLTHINLAEVRTFNCDVLTHKSLAQVQTYKCPHCPYITKVKYNLKTHILVHNDISECVCVKNSQVNFNNIGLPHKSLPKIKSSKCNKCRKIIKAKHYLESNILSQKKVKTFKCAECSYVTKHKYHLNIHVLTHRSLSDVPTYKCDKCPYVTKIENYFKKHVLRHKSLSEVKTFSCAECTYVTKRKFCLKIHVQTHKRLVDLKTYQCTECPYTTNIENYLKRHVLTHKNFSQVPTFKCSECLYLTNRKSNLKSHMLIHKSSTQVEMFQCAQCSYVTKHKSCLVKHLLTHKILTEVKSYKCPECPYVTKHKGHSTKHRLSHKNISDVRTFECAECSYVTRHKSNLKKHVLTHKSLTQVKTFKCA